MWYDETVSLFLARQDLVSLTRHTAGDIHPPLYYYLLHFWGQLAGWSEFSAAFFSLFFGVLLIAIVYRVAREWADERNPFSQIAEGRKPRDLGRGSRKRVSVGVLAAFLVAISPYNLWYSQEVRMYTLGAVLGLASFYCFVRLLKQAESSRRSRLDFSFFLAYAGVSALGLYTLYYFVFLLAFENLLAIVWLARGYASPISNLHSPVSSLRSRVFVWLVSQFAILVLYVPWLPIAFRQATNPPVPPWRGMTPLGDVLLESFSALAFGQSVDWHSPVIWFVLCVIALILLVALRSSVKSGDLKPETLRLRSGRALRLRSGQAWTLIALCAYTFVPLLLISAFSLWKPLYHVRYIFLYSPPFYVLLAVGLDRMAHSQSPFPLHASRGAPHASRIGFLAALLLLTVVSAYSAYNFWFDSRYAGDDLRGAVQRLAAEWRPGDAILLDAGYTYTAFDYYYDQPVAWRGRLVDYVPRAGDAEHGAVVLQTGSIGGDKSLGWASPESDFYATTAEETRAALDRVFAAHSRVWLLRLYDTVVDPEGFVRDYLAARGRIIDDQGFQGESYARVQGYLTGSTAFPGSATSRRVLLGGRIALVGFEPNTIAVGAGESLGLNLYWQADEPTNVDMHLFVGLFGEDGALVASGEEVPIGNAFGTSKWPGGLLVCEPLRLAVPRETPPGNYVLRVALFNPLTGEPLPADNHAWVVEGSQIELAIVLIRN